MRSGLARFFGACGVVSLVAAGVGGCGGGAPSGPTPAARSSAVSSGSDAGGSDVGAASDGGGEVSGRTANLPPENAALEAPDFKDYTGISYETDQGAQETARYFFDAMYYGYATGDTSPILNVGDPSVCSACADVLEEVGRWRSEGRYISVPNVQEDDLFVVEKKTDYVEVQYEYSVEAFDEYVDGSPETHHDPRKVLAVFHLTFEDGRWTIIDTAWKKLNDEVA